ncbi:hypothetical protein ACHAXT_010623 [Thalassiosira profunda]
MVDSTGGETTPLLLDSLSPPQTATSSLSLLGSHGRPSPSPRHRGSSSISRAAMKLSGYPGARSQRRARVHPLHAKPTATSSSTYRHHTTTASDSRRFASSTNTLSTSSTTSHATTPNRIWQLVVSLPYNCLCFASPICSPCCGVCCCFACIRSSEYGVLERFGKFERILEPGMHVIKWPMERQAGIISMRIRQLDLDIQTKSKDHVFVRVHVSIQYQTNAVNLFEAFYSLQSHTRQITTQTHDILRSVLPQLELDDIFSSQDSIANELHGALNDNMNQYGYLVHHALICKITPNEHVMQSMNEMEASKRMKQAMPQKAEAVRIEKVKAAEAQAERAYLSGVGVARERRAIAGGMKEVVEMVTSADGKSDAAISTKGVMDLLLLTQYMDVLTDLNRAAGSKGNATAEEGQDDQPSSTSLFAVHMPGMVSQLSETARKCFGDASSDAVKVENLLDLELV